MSGRSELLKKHLKEEHNISAFSFYLREIVYGGTDGIVTTFAVVAGFAGAQASLSGSLPVITVLLFGFANLFADGVSMAFGSFLATRSEHDMYHNEEGKEKNEVHHNTQAEKEETIDILVQRGFTLEDATSLTSIYMKNESYWIDFMMREELMLPNPEGEHPVKIAVATFTSFVFFGLLPLIPYLVFRSSPNHFMFSIITTGIALVLLGFLRYKVTRQSLVRALSESLLLGGSAAAVAYIVGTLFKI
jgi:VIT1/CCC1 family predicted Fe2+/Mn2+ transporter